MSSRGSSPRRSSGKNSLLVPVVVPIVVALIGLIGVVSAALLTSESGVTRGREAAVAELQPTIDLLRTQAPMLATTAEANGKQTAVAEMANTVTTLETSIAVNTASRQYSVLVDARHGVDNSGIFSETLPENFRFTRSITTTAFTLEYLREYDVVVIEFYAYRNRDGTPRFPGQQTFTNEEIEAIKSYVNQGGRLFLVGIGWVWTSNTPDNTIQEYPLNKIASSYGIFFTNDARSAQNGQLLIRSPHDVTQHPIAEGIGLLATTPDAAPGTLNISSPASRVIDGNFDSSNRLRTFVAAVENGRGRIVAVHHPDFVKSYLDNANYDNSKLLVNIMKWLIG